jgi:hypothetical protein
MTNPQTLIAEKGQSQPRPAAYLGAIRPQPPGNAKPVLLLSNPINLLWIAADANPLFWCDRPRRLHEFM